MYQQFDKQALMEACRELARCTLWQTPDPYSVLDIIDEVQIGRTIAGYLAEATLQAGPILGQGSDPNVVTRAVRFLAYEVAMPPMKDDQYWFSVALTVLLALVHPTSPPSQDGAAFMADLEVSSVEYQRALWVEREQE